MAYRIDYAPALSKQGTLRWRLLRIQAMTAAILLLFTLLVSRKWPEGSAKLRECLIPQEAAVQEAFAQFASELNEGEPVGEALTAFCRQIIENAQED